MYESQYKCISARHARRAVPATRRPRVTECHRTVTKPSQNVTDCSKMSQRRRAARARRGMPATPRPPRGARRPPPACHRSVTEVSQNVTAPPCRARQAAHARHATPAARRPPPAARASCRARQTAHLGTVASGKAVRPHHYTPVVMCYFLPLLFSAQPLAAVVREPSQQLHDPTQGNPLAVRYALGCNVHPSINKGHCVD